MTAVHRMKLRRCVDCKWFRAKLTGLAEPRTRRFCELSQENVDETYYKFCELFDKGEFSNEK